MTLESHPCCSGKISCHREQSRDLQVDSGLAGEKTLPGCSALAAHPVPTQIRDVGQESLSPPHQTQSHPLLSNTWPGSLTSHLQENRRVIKVAGVSARMRCEFGHPWVEEGCGTKSLLCRSTLIPEQCSHYHLRGRM